MHLTLFIFMFVASNCLSLSLSSTSFSAVNRIGRVRSIVLRAIGSSKKPIRIQVDPNDPTFRAKRVFISNIPKEVTWVELKDYVRQSFPNVAFANISVDMKSGQSKGCGLVQFSSPEEAEEAIEKLNGSTLNGAKLFVRRDVQERKVSKDQKVTSSRWKDLDEEEETRTNEEMMKKYSRDEYIDKRWKDREAKCLDKLKLSQQGSITEEKIIVESKIVSREEFLQIPYSMNPSSEPLLKKIPGIEVRRALEKQIGELIEQREEKRRARNFDEADEIRKMLLLKFNVQCDDSLRTWRIKA